MDVPPARRWHWIAFDQSVREQTWSKLGGTLRNASWFVFAALLFGACGYLPNACFAATSDSPDESGGVALSSAASSAASAEYSAAPSAPAASEPAAPATPQALPSGNYGWFVWGVGFDASSLGLSGQLAVQVMQRANVRVGFNGFDYHGNATSGGIPYKGDLRLESVNANFDYFLFRNFHVSPGVLIYDHNNGSETGTIPGGDTFNYGNTTYESSTGSPAVVNARLGVIKVAPEILFGYGNMIPRRGRRWAWEVEAGIAYQGSPKVALGLTGFVCAPPNDSGSTCVNSATDPSVQSDVRIQEAKDSSELSIFRFYPVVSIGISYSF
jgi:hypothetical protein